MENFNKLFKGRIGRKHYFLGNTIILGIGLLVMFIYPANYLSFLFTLLTLPITMRRLHDVGLSGYLSPIGWASYMGNIFTLIAVVFNLFLYFKKGNEKTNNYGDKPRKDIKFIDAIFNIETPKK